MQHQVEIHNQVRILGKGKPTLLHHQKPLEVLPHEWINRSPQDPR